MSTESFSNRGVGPGVKLLMIAIELIEIVSKAIYVKTSTTKAPSTPTAAPTKPAQDESATVNPWTYHLKTVWLFTVSDLKTIVGPKTALGTFLALCICTFAVDRDECTRTQPPRLEILARLPCVAFWVWINLLPLDISNQRLPGSIEEDGVNKPWRPLPSGRLSPESARNLMIGAYVSAFVASIYLGGMHQHLALIVLGYLYNDVGAANESWLIRNLVNALGFVVFGSGALDVALGGGLIWSQSITIWFAIVCVLVTVTVQTQDMFDQVGDAQRGRCTMPLVLGDGPTRWITALTVPFGTYMCVLYWDLSARASVVALLLSLITAVRGVCVRSKKGDKITYKVWNLWVVSIYGLPLVKYYAGT